eukprot:COSAG01_NODE_13076_length_1640_cov_1.658014_2_plen_122_part_00
MHSHSTQPVVIIADRPQADGGVGCHRPVKQGCCAHRLRRLSRPTVAMLLIACGACVISGATATFNLANHTVTGMCVGNSNSSQDVSCPADYVRKANQTGVPASRHPANPPQCYHVPHPDTL